MFELGYCPTPPHSVTVDSMYSISKVYQAPKSEPSYRLLLSGGSTQSILAIKVSCMMKSGVSLPAGIADDDDDDDDEDDDDHDDHDDHDDDDDDDDDSDIYVNDAGGNVM